MHDDFLSFARRFLDERRSHFEAPTALDAHFERFADRVTARQPRGDNTIVQLPVLGSAGAGDLVPIFHNGVTYAILATVLSGTTPSPVFLPVYNIKTYGAKVDGISDDTLAWQTAITVCSANGGGIVYQPAGTSVVPNGITGAAGVIIMGASQGASTLLTSNNAAAVITLPPGDVQGVMQLHLSSSFAGNTTIGISCTGATNMTNKQLRISGLFSSISVTAGSSGCVDWVAISAPANAGSQIIVNNTGGSSTVFWSHIAGGCQPFPNQASAAIELIRAGGMVFSDCNFEGFNNGLLCDPPNGGLVVECFFNNCDWDTSVQDGVALTPAAGGIVERMFFTNSRSSTSINAAGLNIGINGTIDGVTWTGGALTGNGFQGAIMQAGGTNVNLSGVLIAGNAPSGVNPIQVLLQAGSGSMCISGCTIGGTKGRYSGGNLAVSVGVDIAAGYTGSIAVVGCDLTQNGLAGVFDNTTTTNPNKIFQNNVGYNPLGKLTAPGVPVSGAHQQNFFGMKVTIYVVGGTFTQANRYDKNNANATNVGTSDTNVLPITLEPGEYVSITYTGNPTWTWFGS